MKSQTLQVCGFKFLAKVGIHEIVVASIDIPVRVSPTFTADLSDAIDESNPPLTVPSSKPGDWISAPPRMGPEELRFVILAARISTKYLNLKMITSKVFGNAKPKIGIPSSLCQQSEYVGKGRLCGSALYGQRAIRMLWRKI
jgi:hypothetical protein